MGNEGHYSNFNDLFKFSHACPCNGAPDHRSGQVLSGAFSAYWQFATGVRKRETTFSGGYNSP